MSNFVFVELPPQPRSKLPPPEFPFPIRTGVLMQSDLAAMPLEVFLQELSAYLDENPDRLARYKASGAAYAKWAALDLATDGMIEPALEMFELCLRLSPDDHQARMAYAVALHSREYRAEALDQYSILMAEAPLDQYWRAYMLAAEIYSLQGNYALARALMEEAVFAWPQDGRFWGFLGELQDKTAPKPPPPPACPSCGANAPAGAGYCGFCGARLS